MNWECAGPGVWKSGPYTARKINRHRWELYHNDQVINDKLAKLDACKQFAQDHEDAKTPIQAQNYPLAGVKRIEVIDRRHGAPIYGRAYTAYEVRRAELSFRDANTTLKVLVE